MIYNPYKTFIQLRNASKALTYGELEPVNFSNKELCAFLRSANDESVLVLHNLSKTDVTHNLPDNLKEYSKVAFKNKEVTLKNNTLIMPAYGTVIPKK